MAKTQKQIDEFFKSKKEQEQTLQPRSQMILNDEPLPSSKKNYQVTELDRVLQQAKEGFPELEEPNHYKMGNDLLMRDIEVLKIQVKKGKEFISQLQKQNEDLKLQVSLLEDGLTPIGELNEFIELEEYRKLKSEVHKDIEKVWMFDSAGPLDDRRNSDRVKLIERVFYKIANQWID